MGMFGRDASVTTTFNAKDNMSPVVRGIRRTMDQFKRDASQGFGLAAGFSVFDTAKRAIGGVVDFMGDAVNMASDWQEQNGKVGQVFGELADDIRAFADDAATNLRMSERAALAFMGTTGNLFSALGVGAQDSVRMSKGLAQLAADLASFNNTDVKEVIVALQSGLVGETEPMRRFGANLSAARVQAEVLRMGLAKTASQITESMKVTARYNLMMQDTAKAHGDAAKTADGLAGASATTAAMLEEIQTDIGQALLPVMKELAIYTRDELIPIVYNLMETVGDLGEGFNELNRMMNPSTADAQDYEAALRGLAKEMGLTYEEVKKVSDTMSVPAFAEGTEQSVIFAKMLDEVRSRLLYLNAMKLQGLDIASIIGGDSSQIVAAAEATGREYVEALFGSLYRRNVVGDPGRANIINQKFDYIMGSAGDKAGRQFVAGLFGSIDKNSRGATINQAWWNRALDVPDGPRQVISGAFVAMFKTMKSYRSEWNAEWENVVDGVKDPFRPWKLEKWVAKRVEETMKEARDKANPEAVRRRYRQVARAMTSPIFAALVELGLGIDEAVADILMVQRLGQTLNSVGNTIFGAVTSVFGADAPKKRKKGKKRNAMGGSFSDGDTLMVGENGPEVITLTGGGGNVLPNHRINQPIIVNVDGRRLFEITDARSGRAIAMGGA